MQSIPNKALIWCPRALHNNLKFPSPAQKLPILHKKPYPDLMSAKVGDVFKPGDRCEQSGIYKVTHDPAHAQEHEVTCVRGKDFPPCGVCKHPRFKLVRAARHIETHEFFRDFYRR
jgi:hypothetical protein